MDQLPLYTETQYVVDTSSFVDVGLSDSPGKVWPQIYEAIDRGKILTVSYVFPELERMVGTQKLPEDVFEELKARKRKMVIPDHKIINEAGRINHKYPKLGDWRDARNRADPWLIAAASVGRHLLVTEERDTGPKRTIRIPWVCDQEKVKWTRIARVIETEGFDK